MLINDQNVFIGDEVSTSKSFNFNFSPTSGNTIVVLLVAAATFSNIPAGWTVERNELHGSSQWAWCVLTKTSDGTETNLSWTQNGARAVYGKVLEVSNYAGIGGNGGPTAAGLGWVALGDPSTDSGLFTPQFDDGLYYRLFYGQAENVTWSLASSTQTQDFTQSFNSSFTGEDSIFDVWKDVVYENGSPPVDFTASTAPLGYNVLNVQIATDPQLEFAPGNYSIKQPNTGYLFVSGNDAPTGYELGEKFVVAQSCQITELHWYKHWFGVQGDLTLTLDDVTGDQTLATKTISVTTETGWQTAVLDTPINVDLGNEYMVRGSFPSSVNYTYITDFYLSGFPRSGPLVGKGGFWLDSPGTRPTNITNSSYGLDVTANIGQGVIGTDSGFVDNSGSVVINKPATAAAGDRVVVQLLGSNTGGFVSPPAGWKVISQPTAVGDFLRYIAYKDVVAEDTSWTFTVTSANYVWSATTIRGIDTVEDYDITSTNGTALSTSVYADKPSTILTLAAANPITSIAWSADAGIEDLDETIGGGTISHAIYSESLVSGTSTINVSHDGSAEDMSLVTIAFGNYVAPVGPFEITDIPWTAGLWAESQAEARVNGAAPNTTQSDLVSGNWAGSGTVTWETNVKGTGRAAYSFDDDAARFVITPTWNRPEKMTAVVVGWANDLGGDLLDGGASNRRLLDTGGTAWRTYAGSSIVSGGTSDENLHLFIVEFDANGDEAIYVDQALVASGNAGNNVNSQIVVGSSANGQHNGSQVAFAGVIDRTLTDQEKADIWSWYQATYAPLADPFIDNFDGADGRLQDRAGWEDLNASGHLSVNTNEVEISARGTGNHTFDSIQVIRNVDAADQYIKKDVTVRGDTFDTWAGLALRVQSDLDHYLLQARVGSTPASDSIEIFKRVSGTWTSIGASTGQSFTVPFELKFIAEGTSLRGYVDGLKVIETTDATLTSGFAGLLVATNPSDPLPNALRIDNVEAGTYVPPSNVIQEENAKPGHGTIGYDIPLANGTVGYLGYSKQFSVNAGSTIDFAVDGTNAAEIAIYRIGHYGGSHRRLITTISNTGTAQSAGSTITDSNGATAMSWSNTASWAIPADAVSGLYVGVVRDSGSNAYSWIPFIVRNDSRNAEIVVKVSDSTWGAAYNYFGNTGGTEKTGANLYGSGQPVGNIGDRAFAVSYDRPIVTRDTVINHWDVSELPLIDWLEENGYDVKYISCYDLDQQNVVDVLGTASTLVSIGHDEYWSQGMWDNAEAFRDAGGNLIFMSGNEIFWRVRWADGGRTMWCYKDTEPGPTGYTRSPGDELDPVSWTGTWRDTRRPGGAVKESLLSGTFFRMNNTGNDKTLTLDGATYASSPFWRNTDVGTNQLSVPAIIGFEADDHDSPNTGSVLLAQQTINIDGSYVDINGENKSGNGNLIWGIPVFYASPTAGITVGFGTIQWSWGLSNYHARTPQTSENVQMRQATTNLLYDLGHTAATLQSDLVEPTPVSFTTYGVSYVEPPAGYTPPTPDPDADMIYGQAAQPNATSATDNAYILSTRFSVSQEGTVQRLWWYKHTSADVPPMKLMLINHSANTLVDFVDFDPGTETGWVHADLPSARTLLTGTIYGVAVWLPAGTPYSYKPTDLPITNGAITGLGGAFVQTTDYTAVNGFSTFTNSYLTDIEFIPTPQAPATLANTSFWYPTNPAGATFGTDGLDVVTGNEFSFNMDGLQVEGIYYYKTWTGDQSANTQLQFWNKTDGTLLASKIVDWGTETGWIYQAFDSPVPVSQGITYIAAIWMPATDQFTLQGGENAAPPTYKEPIYLGGSFYSEPVAQGVQPSTSTTAAYYVDILVSETLNAPTNVVAVGSGDGQVDITWDAVAGVDGYRLYVDGVEDTGAGLLTGTSYTKSGLVAGQQYDFQLTSELSGSESSLSTAATEIAAKVYTAKLSDVYATVGHTPLVSAVQAQGAAVDFGPHRAFASNARVNTEHFTWYERDTATPLYGYAPDWLDGATIKMKTGTAKIIEWHLGDSAWRETDIVAGGSDQVTIDYSNTTTNAGGGSVTGPFNNTLIEHVVGSVSEFEVYIWNATPPTIPPALGPATVNTTWRGLQSDSTNSATYAFNTVDIGTDSEVLGFVFVRSLSAIEPVTITIDSNPVTIIDSRQAQDDGASGPYNYYAAFKASSLSGPVDISVTATNQALRCAVALWSLDNAPGDIATAYVQGAEHPGYIDSKGALLEIGYIDNARTLINSNADLTERVNTDIEPSGNVIIVADDLNFDALAYIQNDFQPVMPSWSWTMALTFDNRVALSGPTTSSRVGNITLKAARVGSATVTRLYVGSNLIYQA